MVDFSDYPNAISVGAQDAAHKWFRAFFSLQ